MSYGEKASLIVARGGIEYNESYSKDMIIRQSIVMVIMYDIECSTIPIPTWLRSEHQCFTNSQARIGVRMPPEDRSVI
jgi:hypothetical protein